MKKRLSVGYLFLALILATAISCSSNDKKDEGVSPDVAEATSDVPGDGSAPADDGTAAPPDSSAPAGDVAQGDQAPPADGAPADPNAPPADASAAAPAPDMAANGADAAALDSAAPAPADPNAPVDPNAAPPADAATAPIDPNAGAVPDTTTPPATADNTTPPPADAGAATPDQSQPQGDLFGANGGASDAGAGAGGDAGDKPVHHKVGIAHIKDAPFKKGGQLLNTVYIARDGDTLSGVSQKLFGDDKSKALKKANPTLKKALKPGDKVYFNSPNRPDDKEKMLTVYEDQGLPPAAYTTKDGDTLKSLAQEWYGNEDSYKEIYAINKNLSSTKELPAGTELQYWPATVAVGVYGAKKEGEEVAQNNPPPPEAAGPPGGAPPPPPMGGNPPPPMGGNPPPMANNAPPPPMGGNPPPPGAAMDNNPLPPPPPPPMPDMNGGMGKHKTKDLSNVGGMDKDTIMYAAAAGVLLIGCGLLIAVRRRNARKNSGITQV